MPARYSGTCRECGNQFERATSELFCSVTCYQSERKRRTERVCKHCGTRFFKKSQGHHGAPQYCSMACQALGRRTLQKLACSHCGKFFERKPSQAAKRPTCSVECMAAQMQNQAEINCAHCGTRFSVIRWRERLARFCSRRCKVHFHGESAIEVAVRSALDRLGIAYQQEHPLHPYSIDFYLPEWKVALEADGLYWHIGREDHDNERDEFLAERGIETIRINDFHWRYGSDALPVVQAKLFRLLLTPSS